MADPLASHPVTRRLPLGRHGAATAAPLVIREMPLAAATVIAGRGQAATIVAKATAAFGSAPVDGSVTVTAGDLDFVGIGPGRWLVLAPGDGEALVARLEGALAPEASIVDQSGGQVVFAVDGAASAEMLTKLLTIDLDAQVFPVGSAATTIAAHVGVTLWRTGADSWTFVVGRSYAVACERALVASAAEYGVTLGA